MKRSLCLMPILLLLTVKADEPNWAWLSGNWVHETDNVIAQENWSLSANNGAVAYGLQIDKSKQRQRFFEFLRITQQDGQWVYRALPGGRGETDFALLKWGAQSAEFANPAHDFPQNIRYWREGDRLCATVSGLIKQKLETETQCWTKR